jgi:hypothetical protein
LHKHAQVETRAPASTEDNTLLMLMLLQNSFEIVGHQGSERIVSVVASGPLAAYRSADVADQARPAAEWEGYKRSLHHQLEAREPASTAATKDNTLCSFYGMSQKKCTQQ